MKIYATTTSETNKPEGKGGNKYLITQLKRGNKNMYDVYFDLEKITVFDVQAQKEVLRIEQSQGNITCSCGNKFYGLQGKEDTCPKCLEEIMKGKKQKDERKCTHNPPHEEWDACSDTVS